MFTEQLPPQIPKETPAKKTHLFPPPQSKTSCFISAASRNWNEVQIHSLVPSKEKKNGFCVSTTVTFSSLYLNTWTAARVMHSARWHTSVKPRKTIALLEPRVEASALAAPTPSFPEAATSQLDEPNSMISQVWIWSQAASVPPSELTETILSASCSQKLKKAQ